MVIPDLLDLSRALIKFGSSKKFALTRNKSNIENLLFGKVEQ